MATAPEAHDHSDILCDMIGEIALAIGKTIHPHLTLCESMGMAAEVAHGSCTYLPLQKN